MIRKMLFIFAMLFVFASFMLLPVAVGQAPIDMFGFGSALDNQGATADALAVAEAADQSAAAAQTLTAQDLINAQNAAVAAADRITTLRGQVDTWWFGLSNERVAEILSWVALAEQTAIAPDAPVEPPADEPEDAGGSDDAEGEDAGGDSE